MNSAFVQAPFILRQRSVSSLCQRMRTRIVCTADGESPQPAQLPNEDPVARKEAAEEMVRRDMELLKAKKAQSGVKPAKKTTLETAKDVVSTVLLADFFVVVGLLVWLVVALVPHFASQNDFLLDPWLSLWQPFIQPVLGVLML
eukprot:IDg10453t1